MDKTTIEKESIEMKELEKQLKEIVEKNNPSFRVVITVLDMMRFRYKNKAAKCIDEISISEINKYPVIWKN